MKTAAKKVNEPKLTLKELAKYTPSVEMQEKMRHLVQASKMLKIEYRCYYGHQAWRWPEHREPRLKCIGPHCDEWMHIFKEPEFTIPRSRQ